MRQRELRRGMAAAMVLGLLVAAGRVGATQVHTVVGGQSGSEQGTTIEALVALALAASPEARAARARVDEADGDAAQSALRPNPTVSVERVDQWSGMGAQTSVGIQWPLDLFRRDARVAAGAAAVTTARASATDRDRLIAADVRTRAVRLLGARRTLALRVEAADAAREIADLAAARVAAGAAPGVERDAARVEAGLADAAVARQHAEVARAAAALRAAVGLPPEAPLVLRETIEEAAQAMPMPVLQPATAVAARGDVQRASASVSRADARETLARQDGRFDVALAASFMRMSAGFPQLGLTPTGAPVPIGMRSNGVMVGAMVVLPWRNRNQGAVASARAGSAAARFDLAAVELTAHNEIDALGHRVRAAESALTVFTDGLRELARQNVEVRRESHGLGRATLLDVLAEERRRIEVEMAYVDALVELAVARAERAAAMGVIR